MDDRQPRLLHQRGADGQDDPDQQDRKGAGAGTEDEFVGSGVPGSRRHLLDLQLLERLHLHVDHLLRQACVPEFGRQLLSVSQGPAP